MSSSNAFILERIQQRSKAAKADCTLVEPAGNTLCCGHGGTHGFALCDPRGMPTGLPFFLHGAMGRKFLAPKVVPTKVGSGGPN